MKDTFTCTLSKEDFQLIQTHDVGRVIFTNEDEPAECLVYYVRSESEEVNEWYKQKLIEEADDIGELDFSVRTYNVLRRAGINTIAQLSKYPEIDLKRIRNMGKKSMIEIEEKMANIGRPIIGAKLMYEKSEANPAKGE